jgi:hypothetical protein
MKLILNLTNKRPLTIDRVLSSSGFLDKKAYRAYIW